MAEIIRGTTPTIKYTFKTVDVTDISVAYLTANQDCAKILDKSLSSAEVGDGYIAWTLTQEETLVFPLGIVSFMCNWKTNGGIRGASQLMNVKITGNQKNEVI